MEKQAFLGKLLRSLPSKAYNFGRLAVTGNELEGALTGARMFTGYEMGLGPQLAASFGFDAARPALVRGLRSVDRRLANRFGTEGTYGRIRNDAARAGKAFSRVSKLAPLADLAGVIQQQNIGFNQFDPLTSVQLGQERTLSNVANALGWEDPGSMRADIEQFQPLIRGVRGISETATGLANRLRSPALQRRLGEVPNDELQSYVTQALQTYGPGFTSKSPYNQAAILDSLVRKARSQGIGLY